MSDDKVLQKTHEFVKTKMAGYDSAHDWWHIVRVVSNARAIAKQEGGDSLTIELGALLHDVADWKFTDGDMSVGQKLTRDWLTELKVDEAVIKKVLEIVEHISLRGGTNKHVMQTLEGKIVQDADRLDALGAIGIARTFSVGASMGRVMHDPDIHPRKYKDFTDYRLQLKGNTTVNQFYERVPLVMDRLNTLTARTIAECRYTYMEQFLVEFYAEWEGKK